jgi:hypothetical protein
VQIALVLEEQLQMALVLEEQVQMGLVQMLSSLEV